MTKKQGTNALVEGFYGQLFDKSKTKYDVGDKILAISFLDSTQRAFDGKMVPEYKKVSQTLGVPPTTLYSWWENRELILKQAGSVVERLPQTIAAKSGISIFRIIQELERRDFKGVSTRDLNDLLKTFSGMFRLYTGKSTANVLISGSAGLPVVRKDNSKRELVEEAEVIDENELDETQ